MAKIELPTSRCKVESYNPKFMIIMGKPKSGKSSFVASIDDNLIIDLEDGYKSLEVMKVLAKNAYDMFYIKEALQEKMQSTGKVPYKFITIDNATRLEEFSIPYAASLYRKTPMGKMYGLLKDAKNIPLKDKNGNFIPDPEADVRTLPNGSGYLYTRQAIRNLIDLFKPYCETLILVTHVKDKQINDNGTEMSEMSVDLAGKTSEIICGEADAVGYLYRDKNKTYLSFEGGNNTIREARPLHLRGKKFCVIESDDNNNLTINSKEIFI